tara:strand:+ start:693 stop:1070 length:378 start_codon:yes stop_codon:yes gene_type:complete
MKLIKIHFFLIILFNLFSSNLLSDENLKNKIYKNLRCLVCQGQSIADSNSDFAQTLKNVVDDKLKDGMQEKEVYNFLSEKYGDWILYNPPLNVKSYILWILPYLYFIFGVGLFIFFYKKTIKQRK